ncbi:hypothetical protein AAUPMB_00860 [Pasteurella multocida subsp. multocida str. Anand1_buffalo]|nr:hypothetical protein AAUPMB_00860 [Pasteurella multocida subsp. multocida str. Anand1_buffalo]
MQNKSAFLFKKHPRPFFLRQINLLLKYFNFQQININLNNL